MPPQQFIFVIVLSALTAATVFAMVLTVFFQPEMLRRTAEAEAALENASVHNPTFDEGVTHGLLLPLVAIAHHVNAPRLKRSIRQDLVAWGRQYRYTSTQWFSLCFLGAMIGAMLGLYIQYALVEEA